MSIKPINRSDEVAVKIVNLIKSHGLNSYLNECIPQVKAILDNDYGKEILYYRERLKSIREYARDKNNEELIILINSEEEKCRKMFLNGLAVSIL